MYNDDKTIKATVTQEQVDAMEQHYQGQDWAMAALERMIATQRTYGYATTGKPNYSTNVVVQNAMLLKVG